MPKVTWKLADGRELSADAPIGRNLMQAATAIGVPHVVGECGGCLSCATCHVYVDAGWTERTGVASEHEDAMLDVVAAPRQPSSRLSCQITMTAALDGLVLHVPVQ